jgi:uncharacterized repeat protein (TIGR03803 family)
MKPLVNELGKLNRGKQVWAALVLCGTAATLLPAQTFTTLYNFCSQSGCTDGEIPLAGLVQITNGYLYGTTQAGGVNAFSFYEGTVFKITTGGALTTLYSFCPPGGLICGGNPAAGLVQATNGDLYGTTGLGGSADCSDGCGTVFRINPSGTQTTLYSFTGGADGRSPASALVQATNGDLYGTTPMANSGNGGGSVFNITPGGKLTTLYTFCLQGDTCTDGDGPTGALVQAPNGNLYGTTAGGGAYGPGTVFKITPRGTLTTLYSFCSQSGCPDGASPNGGLVQADDGNFYGTTYSGGVNNASCGASGLGCGTVFKITPSGTLTTIHSFCSQSGCPDGGIPVAGLIQATDGNFYGTTYYGGANINASCGATGGTFGCGTVFRITPSGTLTTLHSFCSQSGCADGATPVAGLIQDTNGTFYGTTQGGGVGQGSVNCTAHGCGTVFSLSVGLGQFVETQTTSGEVGAGVRILGSDLTGATSVTFNGTAATFTVMSRYLITTAVPAGASTGRIEVVIPSRTLSSNVAFRVLP